MQHHHFLPLVGCTLLTAISLPSSAQTGYRIETMFELEDGSPYSEVSEPALNSSGVLAFRTLRPSYFGEVIVRLENGVAQELLESGPGLIELDSAVELAENGDVLMSGRRALGEGAVFAWDESEQVLELVADRASLNLFLGSVAANVLLEPSMNAAGQVGFRASSEFGHHLLLWTDGVLEQIAFADGLGAAPWFNFHAPQLDDDGTLVVRAQDDSLAISIVRFTAGGFQVLHTPSGGSPPTIVEDSSGGYVLFRYGTPAANGFDWLLLEPGGGVNLLAEFGCGQAYFAHQTSNFRGTVNSAGQAVFRAFEGGCSKGLSGLFTGPDSVLDAALLESDVIGGATGPGLVISVSDDGLDASGRFAFAVKSSDYPHSSLSGSSGSRIFLATPSTQPELPVTVSCVPSAGDCPCGNDPAGAETGCANSNGTSDHTGAYLEGFGSASIAVDDAELQAGGLPHNKPVLLFAGTSLAAGSEFVLGDGLRCAGGALRRLGLQLSNSAGMAYWDAGLFAPTGFQAGETITLQAWYRDGAASPCGSGFNVSRGLEVALIS